MGKTRVEVTYRIADDEFLAFSVTVPAKAYPQVMAEAKATVLALLREGLADVMEQTRPTLNKDA